MIRLEVNDFIQKHEHVTKHSSRSKTEHNITVSVAVLSLVKNKLIKKEAKRIKKKKFLKICNCPHKNLCKKISKIEAKATKTREKEEKKKTEFTKANLWG